MTNVTKMINNKLLIGRSEWCALPQLRIPLIKAKIDTGAKTSALHAFNIKLTTRKGNNFVSFDINPLQTNDTLVIHCHAPVIDQRAIVSSNGHKEQRYVITTTLQLGPDKWPIEVTLSNRDPLRYRMLLGREALNNRVLINPGISCFQGKPDSNK